MRFVARGLALAILAIPFAAAARGGGHSAGGRGAASARGPASTAGKGGLGGASCPSGARTHPSGPAIRELEVYRRDAFQRRNPCPSTGKTSGNCPGYVMRDVEPDRPGGAWTLRWMTTAEAGESGGESD